MPHRFARPGMVALGAMVLAWTGQQPSLANGASPSSPTPTAAESRAGRARDYVIHSGSLDEGRYRTVTVTLYAGQRYSFAGECDDDCYDMDLKLYSYDWTLIDQDLLPDKFPVVSTVAPYTGRYRIRTIMAGCSIEPCGYEVSVEED